MLLKRAVGIVLLCFLALFSFQLLWTHDRLERLRHLGRRGLLKQRQAGGSGSTHIGVDDDVAQQAMQMGAILDQLVLTGEAPVEGGSNGGGSGGGKGHGRSVRQGGDSSTGGSGGGLHGSAGALPDPAIILFCFDRADYLNETLHSLLVLPGLERYSLYVSQDGDNATVAELVHQLAPSFRKQARGFTFWQKHPRVPQLNGNQSGHAWLAQHYKWGLDRVFNERDHSHAVIVEDDMLFSPDFLLYFEATAPLLDADPTLWCISSWNDNGFQKGHHWDVRKLFRTSYFPGLGWMMKRELWQELGPKWPLDHWDHWMRDEEVSHGRECISPEVNRNKNIGEVGANMNKQAFKRYLKTMDWNENETVTDFGDLSALLRPAYEAALKAELAAAEPWEFTYRRNAPKPQPGKTYLVSYVIERYTRVALRLKLWPYPRGHHQHVAIIPWEGSRFLVADRRFCPLLPPEQQLPPSKGMRPLPAKAWQSCREACAEQDMVCYAKDFWWLNSCAVMRKHFPCENGCTVELGPDVPAYVVDPTQTLHKYCLITQKASTCAAKHASTARLCACVPNKPTTAQARRRRAVLAAAAEETAVARDGLGTAAGSDAAAPALQQQQQQQHVQRRQLAAAVPEGSRGATGGEMG